MHLGSWREGRTYLDLADELVEYVTSMGYTHVEFMPVTEHPLVASWGYQVTGFFAPQSRLGRPDELRHLIDRLHQAGIGVILDWVPGHFPKDDWALGRFDGTALYEHPDERRGEHKEWGTYVFNFGRHEVASFLLSSALYWAQRVPLRRPAGRCGRLDGVPGLRPAAGAVGAQHARRQRVPRGDRLPARRSTSRFTSRCPA